MHILAHCQTSNRLWINYIIKVPFTLLTSTSSCTAGGWTDECRTAIAKRRIKKRYLAQMVIGIYGREMQLPQRESAKYYHKCLKGSNVLLHLHAFESPRKCSENMRTPFFNIRSDVFGRRVARFPIWTTCVSSSDSRGTFTLIFTKTLLFILSIFALVGLVWCH